VTNWTQLEGSTGHLQGTGSTGLIFVQGTGLPWNLDLVLGLYLDSDFSDDNANPRLLGKVARNFRVISTTTMTLTMIQTDSSCN
jgi:hypothetical protein